MLLHKQSQRIRLDPEKVDNLHNKTLSEFVTERATNLFTITALNTTLNINSQFLLNHVMTARYTVMPNKRTLVYPW
jgi:hypothetical protein